MIYEIEIDRESCLACGSCYSTDPTHFKIGNDGRSTVISGNTNGKSKGNFDDEKISDAKIASESCPANAIIVSEL